MKLPAFWSNPPGCDSTFSQLTWCPNSIQTSRSYCDNVWIYFVKFLGSNPLPTPTTQHNPTESNLQIRTKINYTDLQWIYLCSTIMHPYPAIPPWPSLPWPFLPDHPYTATCHSLLLQISPLLVWLTIPVSLLFYVYWCPSSKLLPYLPPLSPLLEVTAIMWDGGGCRPFELLPRRWVFYIFTIAIILLIFTLLIFYLSP